MTPVWDFGQKWVKNGRFLGFSKSPTGAGFCKNFANFCTFAATWSDKIAKFTKFGDFKSKRSGQSALGPKNRVFYALFLALKPTGPIFLGPKMTQKCSILMFLVKIPDPVQADCSACTGSGILVKNDKNAIFDNFDQNDHF